MEIRLTIDNPDLERELYIEEVTVEALKDFVDFFYKPKPLSYQKRDPKQYSHKIEYHDELDEDLSDVKPYSHIEDSAKYVHDLRRERNRV